MLTVYIHLEGLEAALVEIDALPSGTDNVIIGQNPRRRDGKEVPYLLSDVNTVIFPIHKITFIEVIPTGEEEEIETFIRE